MASSVAFGGSSRFAALEIEELSDDEAKSSKGKADKKSNAEKNAKKKARKKKKAAEANKLTNDLRSLAFSKPVSSKAIQHAHHQGHVPEGSPICHEVTLGIKPPTAADQVHQNGTDDIPVTWEEWKNKDEAFVVDKFQRDLDAALRLSTGDVSRAQKNIELNSQKKKSKKPAAMSLDELLHMEKNTAPPQFEENYNIRNGYCPDELDPYHFELEVPLDEVQNINHQSNIKPSKRRKKKATNKSALSDVLNELHNDSEKGVEMKDIDLKNIDDVNMLSMRNDMEEKDILLQSLNTEVETLKKELTQVKKRNKQLCMILAQGEMKDKSEILIQVNDLLDVKNELSEQLSEMHTDLEQERSKVSSLKKDLLKFQNSRTKSKSISEEK